MVPVYFRTLDDFYALRIQTLPKFCRIDGRKIPSPGHRILGELPLLGHIWILRVRPMVIRHGFVCVTFPEKGGLTAPAEISCVQKTEELSRSSTKIRYNLWDDLQSAISRTIKGLKV